MKTYNHRVHYYETDKMGVTHHSNYIRWMEEARVFFLDSIGWSYKKLEDNGIISPVTEVECKYVASTTFDDEITVEVSIVELRSVKISIEYVMKNQEDKVVCKGRSSHCFLDDKGSFISIQKLYPDFYRALEDSMDNNNIS